MTDAESGSELSVVSCPECASRVDALAGGLCPTCGFPLEEFLQFVERAAAPYQVTGLKRQRTGRLQGVIHHVARKFGGQLIVMTGEGRFAVGFISGDQAPADGECGVLVFTAPPVASFQAADMCDASRVDKKTSATTVRTPPGLGDYPPAIFCFGALRYLNLIVMSGAGVMSCEDGKSVVGAALIAGALVGTVLMGTLYHIATSAWDIRALTLYSLRVNAHPAKRPSADS